MNVGERLRERRKRAQLTLGQVAEYEGVSKTYLSSLERGANDPNTWYLLARLAQRYHTTTDYLLGLEAPPPEELTAAQRQAADLLAALPLALQPYALAALSAIAEEWKQAGAKLLAALLADQHALRAAAERTGGESVEIEGESIPGSDLLSLLYAMQQRVENEHT